MQDDSDLARLISVLRVRLCARAPFFGALALFAKVNASERVLTAATNGRDIFINEHFFQQLTSAEQEALFLHEVLHAALLHVPRGAGRERERWNIAADIVVNGILVKEGYSLPDNSLHDPWLEQFSVEEVYDLLQQPICAAKHFQLDHGDLLSDGFNSNPFGSPADSMSREQCRQLEDYWRNAQEQVSTIAETTMYGSLPSYLKRELSNIKSPQLNWRHYLWRYLVQTPIDFDGFDRRFIGQRLYLDVLTGDTVQVVVGVDTSGSILDEQLRAFAGEVLGIVRAYPHLKCDLYYIDTEAHGPYKLSAASVPPEPTGGGGTDFRPFFERVTKDYDVSKALVAVYLTDGYGEFPDAHPAFPVLWVVTPGGLDIDLFPFGEVVRLNG